MPTFRRFAAALLAGVGLGYIVYPPPTTNEEPEITAEQLFCDAYNAKEHPSDKPELRSADEVLAFVAEKYGNFSTYLDTAEIETKWTYPDGQQVSHSTHFNLAYERPDRLRIQLGQALSHKIVSFDRGQAVTCFVVPNQRFREPSFDTALLRASIDTDGLLDWLTSLLMPDIVDQSVWKNLSNATLTVEDSDCYRKLYVIHACAGQDVVRIWVDPQTFLITGIEISNRHLDFQQTKFAKLSPSSNLIVGDDELSLSSPRIPDDLTKIRVAHFEPGDVQSNAIGVAYGGIQIIGSDQYTRCVNGALELLHARDPDSLRLVLKYLAVIDQDGPSGVLPGDTPSLGLPRGSALYAPDFCAALLVYYAEQSRLYSDYREKSGARPPEDIWLGSAAIKACSDRAKQSLIKLGGVPYNINYMMANRVRLADPAPWYPLDLDKPE